MLYRSPSIEILRRAFPGIRTEEAEAMEAIGTISHYPPNTVLCHEDTIESTFYVLIEGEAQVIKRDSGLDLRILKTLYPGDYFGEMALLHNTPRTASVTTTTAAQVLEIEKDDFRHMLEKSESIAQVIMRDVSQRLHENDQLVFQELSTRANQPAQVFDPAVGQAFSGEEGKSAFVYAVRLRLAMIQAQLEEMIAKHPQGAARDAALHDILEKIEQLVTLTGSYLSSNDTGKYQG